MKLTLFSSPHIHLLIRRYPHEILRKFSTTLSFLFVWRTEMLIAKFVQHLLAKSTFVPKAFQFIVQLSEIILLTTYWSLHNEKQVRISQPLKIHTEQNIRNKINIVFLGQQVQFYQFTGCCLNSATGDQ